MPRAATSPANDAMTTAEPAAAEPHTILYELHVPCNAVNSQKKKLEWHLPSVYTVCVVVSELQVTARLPVPVSSSHVQKSIRALGFGTTAAPVQPLVP